MTLPKGETTTGPCPCDPTMASPLPLPPLPFETPTIASLEEDEPTVDVPLLGSLPRMPKEVPNELG